jgi:hypothetical protein
MPCSLSVEDVVSKNWRGPYKPLDSWNEAVWFEVFWSERDQVTSETQCEYKIEQKDGSFEQCVLHKEHVDGTHIEANIPHADKDCNLALLEIRWAEARRINKKEAETNGVKVQRVRSESVYARLRQCRAEAGEKKEEQG